MIIMDPYQITRLMNHRDAVSIGLVGLNIRLPVTIRIHALGGSVLPKKIVKKGPENCTYGIQKFKTVRTS
jgi:hypothetical protein